MGLLHVYYGEGKGKTTAAMGLALRALGSGMKVVVMQCLKHKPSGEVRMLDELENTRVFCGKAGEGFVQAMTEREKSQTAETHTENFRQACMAARDAQMLILDEMLGALEYGLFPPEALLAFLDDRPEGLEVVLTGRVLLEELRKRADYITEMRCVRHPYQRGVLARQGIEF